MGADQNIDWHRAAASALDWWADAGVDVLVDEAPRDWLAAPVRVLAAPVGDALPGEIAAFLDWRTGPAAPEADWSGALLTASGPAHAPLMVLVDCPERDDRDCLLGGKAGALFDRMLAAIGTSRDEVHLAAVCTRRPTAGRIARDLSDRLGTIARHHVALAGPKRLLVLGDAASRAMLGTEVTRQRGRLHALNHRNGTTGHAVASFHPRFLLDRPACKADAWKDLQMLMGAK